MKIEMMKTRALRPYSGNARTHSKKQIRQIAESIKRFGFNNPILIGDDLDVVAGHGRLEAAKLLGRDEVPVVRLSHLSPAERRAYVIADNRLAEKAGWDRELLAIEFQGLIELGFEVELTGFEMGEIDVIIGEVSEDRAETGREDLLPDMAKGPAVTRPGDVWLLRKHRLGCGDAREAGDYTRVMQAEKAEFVFTDLPYNVPIDGHVSGLGRIRHREFAMGCGEMSPQAFAGFLRAVFTQLVAFTADGSIHQVCMDGGIWPRCWRPERSIPS